MNDRDLLPASFCVPTIPNILTLLRIGLIPIMTAAFYAQSSMGAWIAATCFLIACVTDYLDGLMARLLSQTSKLGQFLDPTADKLLIASTVFLLAGFDKMSRPSLIPALIILCREILVSGLREILLELKVPMPVTKLAKWKTGVQMVALSSLMVNDAVKFGSPMQVIGEGFLWLAAFLTLITGYNYLRAGLKHF